MDETYTLEELTSTGYVSRCESGLDRKSAYKFFGWADAHTVRLLKNGSLILEKVNNKITVIKED